MSETEAAFDEIAYLDAYHDVREAVRLGRVPSGRFHYENYGRKEGRSLPDAADRERLANLWRFDPRDANLLASAGAMRVRTVADLNALVLRHLWRIADVDLVVGIPRSGLLAANLIALHLNVPLVTLDDFLDGRVAQRSTRRTGLKHRPLDRAKIIIVDDAVGSGQTVDTARQKVKETVDIGSRQVLYLTPYVSAATAFKVDIYFEVFDHPRAFEWNLMHHEYTKAFCLDLDGVLCRDPTVDENDEGPAYENFLDTAAPLVIPSRGVGAIVTARLEKYRDRTEAWLHKHRVAYQRLVMLDLPTGHERRRLRAHAKLKADAYARLGASLFVESDPGQAHEIHARTGRPVYCLGTSRFYPEVAR